MFTDGKSSNFHDLSKITNNLFFCSLTVHLSSADLDAVIEKIRKLNSKAGPFDYVFLLGNFDPQFEGLDTTALPSIIPFSTLDASPAGIKHDNGDLISHYGVKELNNLVVGYVTLENNDLIDARESIIDTFDKIDQKVDILVTTSWSVSCAEHNPSILGNDVIDEIVKKLQPRYHLATGDSSSFIEFEPFAWPKSKFATRFINLATYQSKSKWAYAFNIEVGDTTEGLPRNLMDNPYLINPTRKRILEKDSDFDGKTTDIKKPKKVLPSNCHFCFTNPNVEDHMFVSISDHAYLTTAKGPLSVARGDMNFSGHCLLIPIEHIPKLNVGQKEYLESPIVRELNSYEESVVKMNYKKFDMSSVVFEIHSKNSIHFHKQLIPVPKYLIMKFQDALSRQVHLNNERYTSNTKLDFISFTSTDDPEYLAIVDNDKQNYLKFTVYETSESTPTIYISMIQPEDRIDLQFGRRVVAFLLRLPKRVNWTSLACKQTKEQEEDEVRKFQKGYEEFDVANRAK